MNVIALNETKNFKFKQLIEHYRGSRFKFNLMDYKHGGRGIG